MGWRLQDSVVGSQVETLGQLWGFCYGAGALGYSVCGYRC